MSCPSESALPATPTLEPRDSTTSWGLVVTLGAMSACGPFAIDTYLPAFPQIARDLHTPLGNVQLTLSVFLLGLATGQVFWGTLSDHLGRRLPLLAGTLLYAGSAAACASAESIGVLILARFLMGLGGSAGAVLSRAIVRDLYTEDHAARFFSLLMIIGGIAPIIAPSLGSILLAYGDWHVVFWIVSAFGVLCAAAIACRVPETLTPARRLRGHVGAVFQGYLHVLGHGQFLKQATAIGLTSGVLFAYIASAPVVYMELFGVSPRHFGFCFAANAVGLYAAGQLNRYLLTRFSSRTILIYATRLNVLACLLLAGIAGTRWGGLPAFAGVLWVCIASLALVFPNATAAAMAPFADQAGSASAVLGVLQFAIGAASGALVGQLPGSTALPMAGVIAACSFGACTLLGGLGWQVTVAKRCVDRL
ncbi:MAG: multidrug effflux MFS transporter [Bacillota bacterium]